MALPIGFPEWLGIEGASVFPIALQTVLGDALSKDDRLITHLICVRLKHLLYDFWGGGGVLSILPVVFLI